MNLQRLFVVIALTTAIFTFGIAAVEISSDLDGDGIFDESDNCLTISNLNQEDIDGDTVGDVCDNCPFTSNAAQEDSAGIGNNSGPDEVGNACQCGDVTDDGAMNVLDVAILQRHLEGLPPGLTALQKCSTIGHPECDSLDVLAAREALAGLAPNVSQLCSATVTLSLCDPNEIDVSQIDMAMEGALDKFPNAWENSLSLLVLMESVEIKLRCSLERPPGETNASQPSLAQESQNGSSADIKYCGRTDSRHIPKYPEFYFPKPATCLNDACFEHDQCYGNNCIGDRCIFSPQTAEICDDPLFSICNSSCLYLQPFRSITSRIICGVATILQIKGVAKLGCYDSPCSDRNAICLPPAGKCFLKWEIPIALGYPQFITTDSNGNIYVAQSLRIQKFDADGNFLDACEYPLAHHSNPRGVAIDAESNVYLSWTLGIDKLDAACNFISACQEGPVGLYFPQGLAIDRYENLYVADTGNDLVQKFDIASGCVFLEKRGNTGAGQGEFQSPADVAVDWLGNVFVADSGNNRIQKFGPDGTFLMQWGETGNQEGQFETLRSVALDKEGKVFTAEGEAFSAAVQHRIQVFHSDTRFLEQWGSFCRLDTSEGCIDPDGSGPLKLGDGQFNQVNDLAIGNDGSIYAVDLYNRRIQRFSCP
ncbi:MAG: hypothetical protein A3C80_01690 [Candidatus Ryanbacteria bacterium RIFCSPHIGHO2_02_FULL_45_43]|uniref:Dockerin domain-containing protein n=1 Tax=Candidatus Ryanbacteria bacterium RIFCSPHIGHO2_01_45_13 TaxID=1802112 RepID=A0A1G2FXZ7_9BACT|nr:MAG: hypothetical protein A2718_02525 [Candidatus Ryanbacteria bacterium RIFCSPHIGHO2_01_FULL_44_130]OGZ42954.1 MAG: hypothetical protein A2W41_02465 [Candidatus Ryanbacteria bacterium RIFCSPHIGHO2_01_45_13]OGZ48659.1 MAG: hypothetical protein A3C80_01690 [Candidatus Ryanbacteria bacterium RIFCSPHIGHO2_02_FULL_45_43]OGZ50599.1 MAG: hypothetical protein A3E55_03170 [Candidatus Ryanbacteria bacterium RIFCSPHIGHO2_12_FULL_44_20]OGZ51905.1 MAG: hypothetical protein A3A17_00545 [Candidatus Ryanba